MSVCPPVSCKIYTPRPLAAALVHAVGDNSNAQWLEPCVGEGVFISVLAEFGVPPDRITALDLEINPGGEDASAKTSRGVDFLQWALTTEQKFDRIVANPPFLGLTKLDSELRQSALATTSPLGSSVVLSANYWLAFLSASLNLMRPNGCLGFVLPASWDFADYAASIRDEIYKSFERVEIYRCKRPLFDSVQEGAVVLLAVGFGKANIRVQRFEFDDPMDLIRALANRSSRLIGQEQRSAERSDVTPTSGFVRLGEVVEIKLGGVTGAAGFFLLTEQQRKTLRLPVRSLRPVLSKSRHLIASETTLSEWQFLRSNGHRIWLVDPSPAQIRHNAVSDYLESIASSNNSIKERYKIKKREPWYRTPVPRTCHGFLSGMSRHGPWISLNMLPRLTVTNTLYAVSFRAATSIDDRCAWALSLMTSDARNSIASLGRVYADGLVKHEPGDLARLPVRKPAVTTGARQLYQQAVRFLLGGDANRAAAIADQFSWFS